MLKNALHNIINKSFTITSNSNYKASHFQIILFQSIFRSIFQSMWTIDSGQCWKLIDLVVNGVKSEQTVMHEARLRDILFSSKTYRSHNFIGWYPLCSGSEKTFGGVPGLPCLPNGHDRNERQGEDLDHPNQGFCFFQLFSFIKDLHLNILVIVDVVN